MNPGCKVSFSGANNSADMLCTCKPLTIIRVSLTNPSVQFTLLINMTIVLIFHIYLSAGEAEGDKLFSNSTV